MKLYIIGHKGWIGKKYINRTCNKIINNKKYRLDTHFYFENNKQDKENAMDPAKMKSQLDDAALIHRSWDVLACSSVTGEGLAECLKWMSDRI